MKLSHHQHSGRLRPHEHTSYLPLGFLLLFVGLVLIVYTSSAASPPPQAGSIGLSGTVPGSPPTTAATITSPSNQQHFGTSPVPVAGTCPANTLVEVFKNNIFAGSGSCTNEGTFALNVDLLYGQNALVARVYDVLNQAGPDSNTATVYYDALPVQAGPLTALDFGGAQLVLNTDAVYRGIFPQQEFTIPIDILGGKAPFAFNVQWGDSNNKIVSRDNNTAFRVNHTYLKAGTYQIAVQATDTDGRVAFLTVAAIVNGQPSVPTAGSSTLPSSTVNKLLVLWPLYTSAIAIVASFWLGERRERLLLGRRQPIPVPIHDK